MAPTWLKLAHLRLNLGLLNTNLRQMDPKMSPCSEDVVYALMKKSKAVGLTCSLLFGP